MLVAGSLPDVRERELTCVQSAAIFSSFLSYWIMIVAGDLKLAGLVGGLRGSAEECARTATSAARQGNASEFHGVNLFIVVQELATPSRFCMIGLVVVYCRNCFFSGNRWCWMPKAASAAS